MFPLSRVPFWVPMLDPQPFVAVCCCLFLVVVVVVVVVLLLS